MVNLFSFYDNRQCTDVVIDSFHITSFSFNFLFAFGLIWLAMLHHLVCYTFCVLSPMQLQLHLNFVVINHATKLFLQNTCNFTTRDATLFALLCSSS